MCNWPVLLISNKLGRRPVSLFFQFSLTGFSEARRRRRGRRKPRRSLLPVSRQSNLTCLTSNNKQSGRVLLRLLLLMMRKQIFATILSPSPPFHFAGIIIRVYEVNTCFANQVASARNKYPLCLIVSTLQYIQKRENTVEDENPKIMLLAFQIYRNFNKLFSIRE